MFGIFSKKEKATGSADSEREQTCSFCLKNKAFVKKMVTGQKASICLSCAQSVLMAMDDEGVRANGVPTNLFLATANYLTCYRAEIKQSVRDELFAIMSATKQYDITTYSEIVKHFSDSRDYSGLKDLILSLQKSNWDIKDAINWVFVCSKLGLLNEALEYPEIDKSNCNYSDLQLLQFNRISVSIQRETSSERIKKYIIWLTDYKTELESIEYPLQVNVHHYMPSLLATLAECYIKINNHTTAEELLKLRSKNFEDNDEVFLLKGDISMSKGNTVQSIEYWQQGLACSHGENMKKILLERINTTKPNR
jgi:tetratricopeptide (TPR) repeat protein